MARHKHADLIHAWAEGAEIDARSDATYPKWMPCTKPEFSRDREYRVRPEPEPYVKPDVVKVFKLESHFFAGLRLHESEDGGQVRLAFDAETGQLKSAEVLK